MLSWGELGLELNRAAEEMSRVFLATPNHGDTHGQAGDARPYEAFLATTAKYRVYLAIQTTAALQYAVF